MTKTKPKRILLKRKHFCATEKEKGERGMEKKKKAK